MDIPMKSRKRWLKKDVQDAQRHERAQAAATPHLPHDAPPDREHQGAGVPARRGRLGSSRGPGEPAARQQPAGKSRER
jgi:hypothetical protein